MHCYITRWPTACALLLSAVALLCKPGIVLYYAHAILCYVHAILYYAHAILCYAHAILYYAHAILCYAHAILCYAHAVTARCVVPRHTSLIDMLLLTPFKHTLFTNTQVNALHNRHRTRVDTILTYNGKLVGVRTSTGDALLADIVVCNRDLPAAYELLDLPHGQRKARDLSRKEYSASIVAFNWAVDGTFPRLLQHNVFLSEQFRQSWRRPAKPMDFVRWPNFYVHVPNRTDPTAAPKGGDAITVLLPVANAQEMARRGVLQGYWWTPVTPMCTGLTEDDYEPLIRAGRELVLNSLRCVDCVGFECGFGVQASKTNVVDLDLVDNTP